MTISIVVFHPDLVLLEMTLSSLRRATRQAIASGVLAPRPTLFLVANSPLDAATRAVLDAETADVLALSCLEGHGNVGYGAGHNLALTAQQRAGAEARSNDYFLILNPDVELDAFALTQALRYLDDHPDAGLLAPRTVDAQGAPQYLCRRMPSVADLFIRGFLPSGMRRFFDARLARYELRDVTRDADSRDRTFAPMIVSGCFMLYRTPVLAALGGFDPRYFLYFEDYDLSLRTARTATIAYVPTVRIVHHGGGASRKGWRHVKMFGASAVRFFGRFGWRWY